MKFQGRQSNRAWKITKKLKKGTKTQKPLKLRPCWSHTQKKDIEIKE